MHSSIRAEWALTKPAFQFVWVCLTFLAMIIMISFASKNTHLFTGFRVKVKSCFEYSSLTWWQDSSGPLLVLVTRVHIIIDTVITPVRRHCSSRCYHIQVMIYICVCLLQKHRYRRQHIVHMIHPKFVYTILTPYYYNTEGYLLCLPCCTTTLSACRLSEVSDSDNSDDN